MKKVLLVCIALFLVACNPKTESAQKVATSFVGTDITGADFL